MLAHGSFCRIRIASRDCFHYLCVALVRNLLRRPAPLDYSPTFHQPLRKRRVGRVNYFILRGSKQRLM